MVTLYIEQAIGELLSTTVDDETNPVPVYAGIAPTNQRAPFITHQLVVGSGASPHINGPSGIEQDQFQIDMYSENKLEVLSIARQVRLILDGFRGTVTIGADNIRVGGVSKQTGRSLPEDNTDPKLYRQSVDYLFTYEEGS